MLLRVKCCLFGHRGWVGGAYQVGLTGEPAVETFTSFASAFPAPRPGVSEVTAIDAEVVELALLLPRWQAAALENAAHQRGLTAGQMLRRLIGATLSGSSAVAGV